MSSKRTLAELFVETCHRLADKDALCSKVGGTYQCLSFREVQTIVEETALGLMELELEPFGNVILISGNRYEWAVTDMAILMNRAVTVPVYPTLEPNQMEYQINHCEAEILFIENAEQWRKIETLRGVLPRVAKIVIFDPTDVPIDDPHLLTLDHVREIGRKVRENRISELQDRMHAVQPDDLASIVYTSGTTGVPKGVMLTHNNFISNIKAGIEAVPLDETDSALSFLPLSHVLERTAGHFLMLTSGATISYAESILTVADNIREVRPTVMVSVPRLYEKMYTRIMDTMETAPIVRKTLFQWAVTIGQRHLELARQGKNEILNDLQYAIADHLVFVKLREQLGGRIRFMISGGAPLEPKISDFFLAANIIILQGYGLTETTPITNVNRLGRNKPDTVGPPVPGVEIRLAEDGEILVKGPNVMKGYYKMEEATREAFTEDGWLKTGDIGMIDEDEYLKITDRKKELIVTSGGKNIAPQPLELLLQTGRYITQALVIGDKRNFITALIVPNFDAVTAWARENRIEFAEMAELVRHPRIVELMTRHIEEISRELPRFMKIKRFLLLDREFQIDREELTPTLKLRRRYILNNFRDEIEAMYRTPKQ